MVKMLRVWEVLEKSWKFIEVWLLENVFRSRDIYYLNALCYTGFSVFFWLSYDSIPKEILVNEYVYG